LDAGHRYSVFPEGFPSRFFLVCEQKDEEGDLWCSESRRLACVSAARRHGFLDEEQVAKLAAAEVEKLEEAKRTSQEAYEAAFSFLTDEGRAQKAITANQTYGLFRGLAMGSAIVAALFFVLLCVGVARSYGVLGEMLATWSGFAELILFPVVVMIAFAYAAGSFRFRARSRGKRHAREVFDALLGSTPPNEEVASDRVKGTS
jgi:hypothetical protein